MDEKTAEFDTEEIAKAHTERSWDSVTDAVPTTHYPVIWGARTDLGRVRENNEDKFDFYLPEDAPTLAVRGRLWAVADGMGGHAAGQIASEWALKTAVRSYYSTPQDDIQTALIRAITEANTLIFQASRQFSDKNGMGTTIVLSVLHEDTLYIAHAGDSRAYLLRNNTLSQITTDHSWVEEQVRRGVMSREEAEKSPYRNYILRSVGVEPTIDPEINQTKVQPGDVYLLCSDGLCGVIDDTKIEQILIESGKSNPSRACLSLIDAANDAGGKDNITALLLVVGAI
jgi:PPM family protein phosphatase